MKFEEFRRKSSFSRDEVVAFSQGQLLGDAPVGLPGLPSWLLLPFHDITRIEWDEASGTGVIEAVRHNRVDEWFYGCHFLTDPVMPGCWGIDAVWQCLKFFAAWRGLVGCAKPIGLENVSFFGQIRPYDKQVVYRVEVTGLERDGDEVMLSGKASVEVDGVPVYSVSSAQIGTAFWQAPEISPKVRRIDVPESSLAKPLLYSDFRQRTSLSAIEILALSRGTLVADAPYEVAQLPSDQMLEVGRIEHISGSIASGEGEIEASRDNSPLNWFYPMTPGVKPAALSIDAVWQLIGVFQAWGGSAGTGRALGLERVEVFDEIRPEDRDVRYEVKVVKTIRSEQTGDAFVRADAMVFADGRPIMSVTNANVGCHKDIRYLDYPMSSEMAFGGKLKTRKD